MLFRMDRKHLVAPMMGRRRICAAFDLMLDAHRRKLRGVMDYARDAGWDVEAIGGYLAPDIRSATDFSAYDGILLDMRPKLFTGQWKDIGRPIVFIDSDESGRNIGTVSAEVYCDSLAVGALAAEALLDLDAASYAYVPGFIRERWSVDRGRGFLDTLREKGVEAEVFPMEPTDSRSTALLDAECARLARWLRALPHPTAVFAANDAVASLVYAACRKAPLDIPGDVYVLGVDNDETFCEFSRPALSSILVDFESCGYQAAELLDRLMRGERGALGSERTFAPLSVVHRASTRIRIPQSDSRLALALDIIERDACHGLTVSGLSRAVGLSRRTLELLFVPLGKTPAHCLSETRLQRVRDLLLSTSLSITRIAADCGFCSDVYLAGQFKRQFGTTMTEFRRSKGRR